MSERRIWARFLRKYWALVLISLFLLLCVLSQIVPGLFPDWLYRIVNIFRE